MLNFWGPKKDRKVINSSTKCLISVKIAIMTPHIIPLPLVNVWLIFDLQKYVNWLCVFSKVNPCFQNAHVFCMDLQPAADPYNVVCRWRHGRHLPLLCVNCNPAINFSWQPSRVVRNTYQSFNYEPIKLQFINIISFVHYNFQYFDWETH